MNKHLYRIVFNHALGVFQVVSELVRRPGQGASLGDGVVAASVRPVSLGLWVAFGWIGLASVASAQIAGDAQAPGNQRPTVMAAPNNAPLINIQTPSAAGVSRNTYNRFDVGSEGAVLNNSRTNTQTQLAGTVSGNPWLATGTAKVILNEVTGPNPSQLNGYIEVAGDRAQVVIANPSGIACDGCGFINANRVTLTTGVPVLNGGSLDGYRVTSGAIQINGKGMDASRADYADIIARAVQVNGGIWAPQLQITTGANQVNVDQSQVSATSADGNKPAFALDVSALGGMYANKIALLGTEHGLGVRNAGNIGAQAGELTVTVDGRLENTGSLQSQVNTQITAGGGVANAGTISATRELAIATTQDVDNSGGTLNAARIAVDAASMRNAAGTVTQTSAQAVAMQVGALSNRNGGRIGVPEVDTGNGGSSGTPGASTGNSGASTGSGGGDVASGGNDSVVTPVAPLADGALRITGLLDNDSGRITAASGFDLTTGNGIANDGGQLALRQLTLTDGDLSNRHGVLSVDRASNVHAAQVINDGGQLTFAKGLTFDAQALSNRTGKFLMADPAAMRFTVAGVLDNSAGTLASNASQFTLSSGALINENGVINHAGTDGFSLQTGTWQGAGGTVATAGAASIGAGNVDHQNAVLSATQLTLRAVSVDNRGGTIVSSGDQTSMLNVVGALDNGNGGTIRSNADLFISAETLGNAGGTVQHAGQGALGIHAITLNGNGGTIASNGNLSVLGGAINLANGTTYAQSVTLDADSLTTAGGKLTALADTPLNLTVRGLFDNTHGTVATSGALQINAQSLTNTDGTLTSAGRDATAITVTQTFDNTRGALTAMGASTIHGGTIVNQSGSLQAGGGSTLTVTADGLLDNSAKGTLASDGDLSVGASTLDNTQGTIAHAGTGALTIQVSALNGLGGTIASNGQLGVHGGAINLANGTTYAQSIALDADALTTAGGNFTALGGTPLNLTVRGLFDNTHGTVATNGALQINARSLTNIDGTFTSAGKDSAGITIAQTFDNTRGMLAGMGATTVHGGSIVNQGGTIQAGGGSTLIVTADGLLDNSAKGTLTSDGDLSVTASTLDNTQGTIAHAGTGALTIQVSALNGQGGTIASNGQLGMHGGAINLANGTTYAQSITLDGDALTTAGGNFTALGGTPLSLTVRGLFDNTGGKVATNGALQISAQSLINTGGTLTAAGIGATSVAVVNTFDNTRGTLAAMGSTRAQGGIIINQAGAIQAGNGSVLTVTADGLLDNSQHGMLASDGDLTIKAATLDNTQGAIQHAGQGALTIRAATLNGLGGTIASNGVLTVAGGDTNLRNGTIVAQQISIDADTLTTAGGNLSALGGGALHLGIGAALDNTGGHIATNGTLQLAAGSLINANGSMMAAGVGSNVLTVANAFNNTYGTLGAAGMLTLHAGSLDNTGGTVQSASTDMLSVTTDGQLTNDNGTLAGNGALTLHAGAVSNHGGTVQSQQDINATVAGTLDNSGGALIAGSDVSVAANALLNRDTSQADTPPRGIYGHRVQLQADAIDNTRGQIQASDALTLRGRTQSNTALTNASGAINGTGAVTVTASSLDNTAGQLVQRGDNGTLSLTVGGALGNTAIGLIGAEGTANIQAGSFDNSGGTTFARHDLTLSSQGNLLNRGGGQLQAGGGLVLSSKGVLENASGVIDAGTTGNLSAGAITNTGGQILAGNSTNADLGLQVATAGAIDNRGGSIGNRGGDVSLQAGSIDNSASGKLVAQRDLNLDHVGGLNNANGTAYATRQLSYQNGNASLDNTGGTLGSGDTARLTLASLTNNAGRVQSSTLWLSTSVFNNTGGDVGANALHATLSALNGVGYLHGGNLLDLHFLGDYTQQAGQRLESNGTLALTVDGTLTNWGNLQTQGELDITAGNVINQGVINASAADGSAVAHVTVAGQIANNAGASIEGDTLKLVATDVTNTSNKGITGDAVRIEANTLTNGRDLGTADAAVAYGEGFIGAANTLDLRVSQRLANLDGDIYSGGDFTIAGRTDGTRVGTLDNVSGRIQADGNGSIAADLINNRRRFIETQQYTLSPDEQYALNSDRAYDNALTPAEQQRVTQLFQKGGDGSAGLTTAETNELLSYIHRTGWSHVDHVSNADLAILNATYNQIAIEKYGQLGGYLVVGSGGNPGAEYKQTDTYLTGTRVTRESAGSQILTGGNLNIDLGSHLTNFASTIAATRNLTISGQAYSGGSDGRIDNIAVVGQYTLQRDVDALVLIPVPVKYHYIDGSWKDDMGKFPAHISTNTLTATGPVLASSTISGQNVSITARDVSNTAVAAAGGLLTLSGGNLSGQSSHSAGDAHAAQAADVGAVAGASGSTVGNTGAVSGAMGSTVSGPGASGAASGASVQGPGKAANAGGQVVGSADQPLPGLVPPSNGKYSQNGDPGAPFLVTTTPRFAKGASASSDYLLRALGDDPSNTQKRLGDGYYEQQLVLDQLLQLTGRRTLNGDDGLAQYQSLMDGAASEASRLGLTLGAPLTSAQISSLSSDIVWLVDQVVDGQHVLVPVVYLSKATADRLRADGALIAGGNVDVKASGTVLNDGTITGTQTTSISADTLINHGAISGEDRLAIATRGDTINNGKLGSNTVSIQAGGNVVNAPSLDGLAAHGGVINAGAGGLQIVAGNDVVNQGVITSAGNGTILAGRDYVQNAAVSEKGTQASIGSFAAAGNAAVVAGRDAIFDQSTLSAGKVAYVEAGRDAHFTAATVSGGTGLGVKAGQDIVSDTVTDHNASASYTKQGKNYSSTYVNEDTVRGSTFTSGGDLTMQAGRDIDLTAATAKADGAVGVTAGRDINLAVGENTRTETQDSFARNGKKKTTTHSDATDTQDIGTTLSGGKGITLTAGNDINAKAAEIDGGKGAVQLGAGRDINLTVGEATHTETYDSTTKKSGFWSSSKVTTHSETSDTTVIGTTISGNGVAMVAGRDVHATAASITANDGAAVVMAGRDIVFDTANDTHQADSTTTAKGAKINGGDRPAALAGVPSGLLTRKKTTTTITHEASSNAVGTSLTGDSVTMVAGRDVALTATQIGATHDVSIAAGRDLNVGVAYDTYEFGQTQTKKKTGLQESGATVMYGKSKLTQSQTIEESTPQGSMIGSTNGSVTLAAGNNVHLTNATVLSDTGTAIAGKNVTIDAAVGTSDTTQATKQSSSGITAGVGGAAAQAALGVYGAVRRGSEVKDDRLKALYAAQAAYAVSDTVDAFQRGAGNLSQNGTDGGINLQVGIGGSSAKASTTTHDETAYGSTIRSNGNVTIAATGGDLNVIGSKISGDNVGLMAANNINLLSQAEDHTLKSDNKNASGGVGVQIGTDGVGFYAQASVGQGRAHGNGTTHATTSIDAKDTLTIVSGGDTTLQGAQAKGDTVLASIGGNLNIRSEQDTDDYASKQQQASGKVVIGYGGSASGSYNQSNVDSHYASVTTVSGIGAGDGGFNIHVNGNTDLKGGVIASTADPGKNLLDTGSLTFSDIENKAKYSASSVGISGGSSGSGVAVSPSIGIPQGDNSHNTTKAGIADGTIVVRDGNADLSGLDRTATLDQQGLKSIFDLQKVQEQQEMGQVAGYVGMRAAGDISQYMANHATSEAEQKSWLDGGTNKAILHGMVGAAAAALGNGDVGGGALGTVASEKASKAMSDWLWDNYKIGPESAEGKNLMNLASVAIGGVVGGGSGASAALQGEQFNRQLHRNEIDFVKDPDRIQRFADANGLTVEQAARELGRTAAASMDAGWDRSLSEADGNTQRARDFIAAELAQSPSSGGLFQVTQNDYYNEKMGLADLMSDRNSLSYMLSTVAKVDPFTYRMDPRYAQTIALAKGQGSNDGFGAAIVNNVVGFLHSGIALTDAIAYPEETMSGLSAAWDSLKDSLKYKGMLDNLHLMQGDVYGVNYSNARSTTETGVSLGIALGLPGVLKDNPLHGPGLKAVDAEVPLATANKGLGGVVPIEDTGMQFGKGIVNQGKPFEAYVQSQLPDGTLDLNSVKSNFSTFDHLTPDGTAISTKTMDTVGSVTYQNPSAITRTLNGYVDDMVGFEGDGKGLFRLAPNMITGKEMQLGIPYNTSAEQMAAISQSVQYAANQGVKIVVTKVK
jgi:filamentous hemagglutinin